MKTKWVGGITLVMGLYMGLAWGQEQELPTPTDLFNRHWAGIGRREALERYQSVTVTGTIQEGQEVREFTFQGKLPGLILLTTRDGTGKSSRQGRDPGGRFWQQEGSGTRDLNETGVGELAALALAYLPATQIPLSERLAEAVCEMDRTGGRAVVAIGRKSAGGFPRFLFDAESGVLVGVGRARCEEYREVAGVKIPYLIRQGGRSVFRVKTVQFNPALGARAFDRPGGRGGWLSQLNPGMQVSVPLHTQLSATGRLEIVRRPPALRLDKGRLSQVPAYNPGSGSHGQVDLQNADLRPLDLSERLVDLLHADFNGRTRWPERLPVGFDPARVLELGKDPGLGVRRLHAQGITGKGVGVGIIDHPLLTEHGEYADRLRLYEEIRYPAGMPAHMHGSAVASIAVGQHCGVAPEAELYFIAIQNGSVSRSGQLEADATPIVQGIERLLQINASLPAGRKIRVISLSMGWGPGEKGYEALQAVTKRAGQEGVFVISSTLRLTHQLRFDGLNRGALADPNESTSYGPGSWWAGQFWNGQMRFKPGTRLCVPMDGRTTASPYGAEDYVHYDNAGWSWAIPYVAGLYALACQVRPEVTPEEFWQVGLKTGKTIPLEHQGERVEFGTIADPGALMETLGGGKFEIRNPKAEMGKGGTERL